MSGTLHGTMPPPLTGANMLQESPPPYPPFTATSLHRDTMKHLVTCFRVESFSRAFVSAAGANGDERSFFYFIFLGGVGGWEGYISVDQTLLLHLFETKI